MRLWEIEKTVENHIPGIIGKHSFFSVSIPLVEIKGQTEVIYQVRSDKIKRQPGEICFPGGAREKDETDEQCALREMSEEMGIATEDITIVKKLGTLLTYGRYVINVYVVKIGEKTFRAMKPSCEEVSQVFTVPVDFLVENEPAIYESHAIQKLQEDFPLELIGFPEGYSWKKVSTEVPVYVYDRYVIWGITGRITKFFTEILKKSV